MPSQKKCTNFVIALSIAIVIYVIFFKVCDKCTKTIEPFSYANYEHNETWDINGSGSMDKTDKILTFSRQLNTGDLLSKYVPLQPWDNQSEKGGTAMDSMRLQNQDLGDRHQMMMAERINNTWQPQ